MQPEWNLDKETVCSLVTLAETQQEQSIELDYVLEDFRPDFFLLLSALSEPAVLSQRTEDHTVQYTLGVTLTVLYLSKECRAVQAVSQQLTFDRTLPLPADADPDAVAVEILPETAYLNCRAQNPRRMDLRGAVRIRCTVTELRRRRVIGAASGKYLQCKAAPFSFLSDAVHAHKRFAISETLTVPDTQPAVLTPLTAQVQLAVSQTRIIAGKLVVKGEARFTLIYAADDGIEQISAVFPFSQIVEREGLSEEMPCTVTAAEAARLITPEANAAGDIRLLHVDLQIMLAVTAVTVRTAPLLTDAYSTGGGCAVTRENLLLPSAPQPFGESLQMKLPLKKPDAVLTRIYAALVTPEGVQTAQTENGTQITGSLRCCVLAADADGRPLMLTHTEPLNWQLAERWLMLPPVTVSSCEYTLTGSDSTALQIVLSCSGQAVKAETLPLITALSPDGAAEETPAEGCALRLYFAQAGESLWEIAKRYRTAAAAICEENDCPEDTLAGNRMLLIPTVQ